MSTLAPKPPASRPGWPFRKFRVRGGRGIKQVPGNMNGTEAKYAAHLDRLCRAGTVAWFGFQATKLRLSDSLFYTPDFTVLLADGWLEYHEVKGSRKNESGKRTYYAEPQDVVRIKAAAEILPFRFSIVWLEPGGVWGRQDFWDPETPLKATGPSGPKPAAPELAGAVGLFAIGGGA